MTEFLLGVAPITFVMNLALLLGIGTVSAISRAKTEPPGRIQHLFWASVSAAGWLLLLPTWVGYLTLAGDNFTPEHVAMLEGRLLAAASIAVGSMLAVPRDAKVEAVGLAMRGLFIVRGLWGLLMVDEAPRAWPLVLTSLAAAGVHRLVGQRVSIWLRGWVRGVVGGVREYVRMN